MKRTARIASFALAIISNLAFAGQSTPYTQAAFDSLASSGKPVIVDVFATWCTTCAAQKPIQDAQLKAAANKDLTMLTIDFDTEKALLAKFHVSAQSTMIAFKNGKEVGRSVGDTSAAGIAALFAKAAK